MKCSQMSEVETSMKGPAASTAEANRIFLKARNNLGHMDFTCWLCFVYGYVQKYMTEEDLKAIETELDNYSK